MPYMFIFSLKFKKTNVIFKITTLKFFKAQILVLNFWRNFGVRFGISNYLIWVFLGCKTIVLFEIKTLEFVKIEFLVITVTLGEDPGPGPGADPPCKVCLLKAVAEPFKLL